MHNSFKLLIHLREWEETQRTSEKLYGFNEYLSCRWNVQYPLQVAAINCNFNINLMPQFSISFIICRHNYYKLLRPQMMTRKMTHSDDSLTSRLSFQLKKNQAFVILFDYLFFCHVNFQQTQQFNVSCWVLLLLHNQWAYPDNFSCRVLVCSNCLLISLSPSVTASWSAPVSKDLFRWCSDVACSLCFIFFSVEVWLWLSKNL